MRAVNSLLQRARDTLGHAPPPEPMRQEDVDVVHAYVQAFEQANVDSLVRLLRDDARLSMPPTPTWFAGAEAIGAWLRRFVLPPGAAGRFRGAASAANGAPAAALFGPDGSLLGVHVLTIEGGLIAEVVAFMDPASLRFFDIRPD